MYFATDSPGFCLRVLTLDGDGGLWVEVRLHFLDQVSK